PPPSPRASQSEISPQLDAIVLRMLAKAPEDRYPDMGSLTSAIRLAAGPPFSVHRSSPDISSAPTQAADVVAPNAPAGRAAKAQVTTFREGVGEVGQLGQSGQTMTVAPRSRGKLVAAIVAVAALGGGAFVLLGGSKPAPAPVA